MTQINQVIETIDYQVQLSAYYFPTLTDLEDDSPTIDTPPSSKKHNPLFPFIKEENDEQS
ncbi:hypothetical protein [Metabacillus sediminilitoris]|uniref:Uncharacterized protein n=1 Tax=Metabacillus sediminilitoris TaxID=2567941 RepID=A0A4S4C2E9_9BACI|nr:hypothetical protein [Metabacillus sediminilitoris]QGQ47418.1 hypothetical protein GMB29_20435 [Metabacillus sediminilitoris]THF81853.1 hypothetical protein E6W99_04175 [Metabacillus sediminilitoris]